MFIGYLWFIRQHVRGLRCKKMRLKRRGTCERQIREALKELRKLGAAF